jgi:hypothetical protein
MKKLLSKGFSYILGVTIGAILLMAISWLITCLIIKFITWCFMLEFSWRIATGIWFGMILLRSIFKSK